MSSTMQVNMRMILDESNLASSGWITLDEGSHDNGLAITEAELATAAGKYVEIDTERDRDRAAYLALVAVQDMPLIEDDADDEAYEQATRGRARPVAKPLPID